MKKIFLLILITLGLSLFGLDKAPETISVERLNEMTVLKDAYYENWKASASLVESERYEFNRYIEDLYGNLKEQHKTIEDKNSVIDTLQDLNLEKDFIADEWFKIAGQREVLVIDKNEEIDALNEKVDSLENNLKAYIMAGKIIIWLLILGLAYCVTRITISIYGNRTPKIKKLKAVKNGRDTRPDTEKSIKDRENTSSSSKPNNNKGKQTSVGSTNPKSVATKSAENLAKIQANGKSKEKEEKPKTAKESKKTSKTTEAKPTKSTSKETKPEVEKGSILSVPSEMEGTGGKVEGETPKRLGFFSRLKLDITLRRGLKQDLKRKALTTATPEDRPNNIQENNVNVLKSKESGNLVKDTIKAEAEIQAKAKDKNKRGNRGKNRNKK